MKHVIIVGGGIGGLSTALALLRRGFRVTVCERAPAFQEIGAGLHISPNGTSGLIDLGLGSAMKRLAFVPVGKEFRLWNTGETWPGLDFGMNAELLYGSPYYFLHRADLHEIIYKSIIEIDPECVLLNKQYVRHEDDGNAVSVFSSDGGVIKGDVLVGADGVHSMVRSALFGADKPVFSGCVAWRMVMPKEDLRVPVRPVSSNWLGPGAHFVHYFLRGGDLLNVVGVVERDDWQVESWSTQGSQEEMLADFEGWAHDVRAIIESGAKHPHKWALMLRSPLREWVSGRATLLGDAAHPTMPTMSQGANMAIEDGVLFARALGDFDDTELALRTFEAARVHRTAKLVEQANANVKSFHSEELRDPDRKTFFMESVFSSSKMKERFDWVYQYNPATTPLPDVRTRSAS